MIGHQSPGQDNDIAISVQSAEPGEEIFPIRVLRENLYFFNSPPHDVMESSRGIESWLSRHKPTRTSFNRIAKLF